MDLKTKTCPHGYYIQPLAQGSNGEMENDSDREYEET